MKCVNLIGFLSAALLVVGCAQTRTEVEPKLSYVDKVENHAEIVGSHRMEIVRTVTWKSKSACSVLDFVSAVTAQDPTIHDVVNIRSDEGRVSDDGEVMGYSCKYWGLAVRYISVDPAAPTAEPSVEPPAVRLVPAARPAPATRPVPVQPTVAPNQPVSKAPVAAPAPAPASTPDTNPAPVSDTNPTTAPAGQNAVPSIERLL